MPTPKLLYEVLCIVLSNVIVCLEEWECQELNSKPDNNMIQAIIYWFKKVKREAYVE